MRPLCGLLVSMVLAAVSQVDATPTRPGALFPRTSPQPCPQKYVCPAPQPYDPAQFPDLGDDPGPDRFKCRIGYSPGDPNFAFCIYEKDTGNLVGSTPSGLEDICWERGMPNPQCPTPDRRRALPVRNTLPEPQQAADPVVVGRFLKAKRG